MDNLLIIEEYNTINIEKNNDNYFFKGIFTVFDVQNENGRYYRWADFKPHLKYLQENAKIKKLLGELDHPDDFNVLYSRVSHSIENIDYDENKNAIIGTIRLLDTPNGKIAKAVADAGIPLRISSRSSGTINEDGEVRLNKVYTYDLVPVPGFSQAELAPVYESLSDDNKKLFDSINNYVDVEKWELIKESNGQKIYKKKQDNHIMELKHINEKLNLLENRLLTLENNNTELTSKNSKLALQNKILKEKITKVHKNYKLIEGYIESEITPELNSIKETTSNVENYLQNEVFESVDKIENYLQNEVFESVDKIENYLQNEVFESVDKIENYLQNEVFESVDKIENYLQDEVFESVTKIEEYTEKYLVEQIENIIDWQNHLYENLQDVPLLESLFEDDSESILEGKKYKSKIKEDDDEDDNDNDNDNDDDDDDDDVNEKGKGKKTKKKVTESFKFSDYKQKFLERINRKNSIKNKIIESSQNIEDNILFKYCPPTIKEKFDAFPKEKQDTILRISENYTLESKSDVKKFWNTQLLNFNNIKVVETKTSNYDNIDWAALYGENI